MYGRMPVWKSHDKIRTHWLTLLCGTDALYAALTIFGKSDSASQILLRNAFSGGTALWGGVLLGSAVLIYLGWSEPGGAGGAFAWLILAAAGTFSITNGTALSYSGPVLLAGVAGFHVLIIYDVGSGLDEDRERRQRRS